MISITVQEKYLKHCEFFLFCSITQKHSLQHMHPGLTVSRISFQIKAQKLHHISRDSPTFLHVAFQDITKGITLIPMGGSKMCPLKHFKKNSDQRDQKKKSMTNCIVAVNQTHEYKKPSKYIINLSDFQSYFKILFCFTIQITLFGVSL